MYGKMYVGGAEGASANTAVPPATGAVPGTELLPAEQPAATRAHAAAARLAASARRRSPGLDLRCRAGRVIVAAPSAKEACSGRHRAFFISPTTAHGL